MRKHIDQYVKHNSLSINAQRVFAIIELILLRYNTKEFKITKEDIAYETTMSIPGVKVALRELKEKGYIKTKNNNSPIMRVGELYESKEV